MQSAFPDWFWWAWVCCLPWGLAFAARIAWEKTVWTVVRGPQMVGYSLAHMYPGFFVGGALCSILLAFWLIPALVYLVARRKDISAFDIVMVFIALFVAAAIVTPESFFASSR